MIDYERYEVPKHRKKSQKKKPKKSDHKHDYIDKSISTEFLFGSGSTQTHWVFINQECSVCGFSKETSKRLSPEDYKELKEKLESKGG